MLKEVSQTLNVNLSPANLENALSQVASALGVAAQSGSSFQSTASSIGTETKQVSERIEARLQERIKNPDASTLNRLNQVNSGRKAQGKAPIDFAKTTEDVQKILNDSSLSGKEKKHKIEELRKELGLSRGEMKDLFTKRLARLYKSAGAQLQAFQNRKMAMANLELKHANQTYGASSPQAQQVREKQAVIRTESTQKIQEYKENADVANKACKKPGFWSKLGGFFKKAFNIFMKILPYIKPFLNFIPGFGQIANVAVSAFETVVNAIKTKGKSLAGSIANFGKSMLGG